MTNDTSLAAPDLRRFESKFERGAPDSCWPWLAGRTGDGYGLFGLTVATGDFRRFYAHRVAFESYAGPIPEGLDIDHLCRNRACVNPGHMEPVTRRENTLRGSRGPKSHCLRGHALSGSNLITRKNGRHECRTCENARQRRRSRRPSAQ